MPRPKKKAKAKSIRRKTRTPSPPVDPLNDMSEEELLLLSEKIDKEQEDAQKSEVETDQEYFEKEDPMSGNIPSYIDNDLGFHLEINDMHAQRFKVENNEGGEELPYKDFTRDYSNANLNNVEIEQLRLYSKLLQLCKDLGAKEAASWVLRNIFSILATSRAKNGFERRMTVSQFTHGNMKSEHRTFDAKPSGFLMWARKKKGGGGI